MWLLVNHFRREVIHRTAYRLSCRLHLRHHSATTEVADLSGVQFGLVATLRSLQKHVFRLDISVDNFVPMDVHQAGNRVQEYAGRLWPFQPSRLAHVFQELAAGDEFKNEVHSLGILEMPIELHNIPVPHSELTRCLPCKVFWRATLLEDPVPTYRLQGKDPSRFSVHGLSHGCKSALAERLENHELVKRAERVRVAICTRGTWSAEAACRAERH